MKRIQAWVCVGTICICAISWTAWNRPSNLELRPCGHPRDLFAGITKNLPIPHAHHGCFAMGVVTELKILEAAQAVHFDNQGAYARTLGELTNELGIKLGTGYTLNMVSDGTNWSATVDQTAGLPGNYLLSSDGTIYFSQRTPVTSNDVVLRSYRRSK